MAYVISSDCINCGCCELDCKYNAIFMGDEHREINAEACKECGACKAACNFGAISEE